MPGVTKRQAKREGRAFPASRYDDPRGGVASALERNILRYRTIETTLYLFYTEEVRNFMLTTVYCAALRQPGEGFETLPEEKRLQKIFSDLLRESEGKKKLSPEDAKKLRDTYETQRRQGKKLKAAFGYAVAVGIFTEVESTELQDLLEYRNDIAHRIHLLVSDVSRNYWAIDHAAYVPPMYKGDALEKLNAYRKSLWGRARAKLTLSVSMNSVLFEFAEKTFERDLMRLDRLIKMQIVAENNRYQKVESELDLQKTELKGDLSPRFYANHRSARQGHGDGYIPATGHLTKRGVEICYRLFDLGKSPIAVAYLMGMTLRSAERRQSTWHKVGGLQRIRLEIKRFELADDCS